MSERRSDAALQPVATSRLHDDGIRQFMEGHYDEAKALFERALLLDAESLEIRKDLAHALLHLGQRREAEKIYLEVWEAGGRFLDLAHNLALLDLDQRRHADAASRLRDIAGQDFEIHPGRFYLGLLFPSSGHFMAECSLHLGIASMERGRYEGAVGHFLRAVELNPRLHSGQRFLLDCLLAIGEWEKARERGRDLLRTLPHGEELLTVRVAIAHASFELGDHTEARRQIEAVLHEDPTHEGALFHLKRFEDREENVSSPRHRRVDAAAAGAPLFGLAQEESSLQAPDGTKTVIIGQSQAMRKVMRHARLAAASDATVLITGENGTGKELVARSIWHFSPRREKTFIAVNCAALPEALLESELFGHEKGAFTGAHAQKKGRFEVADGGTLFLDEVGDMSLSLQVKLLRILQEKEFTRVGGNAVTRVDVRIIAATNRDLVGMVREGSFREDLYYRLNVLPISIPPLRDRPEEIPLLIEHFLRRVRGGREGKPLFTPEEVEILQGHHWPGNVRELENFVERAVVMGQAGPQLMEELHRARRPEPNIPEHCPEGAFVAEGDLSLDSLEQAYIMAILDRTGGNQKRASEILGISPSTLWRKMKRYNR